MAGGDDRKVVRARRVGGKPFVVALVAVWVLVLAGVGVMIYAFKRGGVDALRIDKGRPAASEGSAEAAPAADDAASTEGK